MMFMFVYLSVFRRVAPGLFFLLTMDSAVFLLFFWPWLGIAQWCSSHCRSDLSFQLGADTLPPGSYPQVISPAWL